MGEGQAARDAHVPDGAGNATDLPVGYRRTEVGVIPKDWGVSTVGAEFSVQLGKMLDAAKNTGVSKPYIGNRSVQWGRIDLSDIDTVPMTSADLRRFRLRSGDLLACEGGEIGRAAIWNDPMPECYYQKALHRLRPKRSYDAYLMMSLLQLWASTGHLTNYVTQTSIAHLPKDKFEDVPLPVPRIAEQRAIASVLSDVDELIGSLEALIAKKRAIKQAAMQELLTGRTRLPGFGGEWEQCTLGKLAHIATGNRNNQDKRHDASQYPFFVRSSSIERIGSYSYDGEAILIPGEGRIGEIFHYVQGRFDVHQRVYAVSNVVSSVSVRFLYFYLAEFFGSHAMQNTVKATVDSLRLPTFQAFPLPLPPLPEQRAIATILSDMDSEITALEQRLDKTRAIKQGMMQQLLTGAIRLPIPSVDGKADP